MIKSLKVKLLNKMTGKLGSDIQKKVPEVLLKPNCLNAGLAKIFLDLGEFEKDVNKKIFKYYAYRRAAHSIMNYPEKITSGSEAMNSLPGVGKKMAMIIDEYLKSGKVEKLENV